MIKAPFHVQNKTEYIKKLESMSKDQPANGSELRQEFKNLFSLRPSYTEVDYKFALQAGNEISSILPLDKYSLFLTSSVPNRTSYINAINLPSSTNNKAFIVTHYPPPEDAVDFLRLLTDHESQVVVCMDPLTNVASSKNWLPRMGCSLSVSPFTVHCKQEEITKFKCTTVDIVRNGMNNETCSVVIVEPIYNLKSSGEPGGGIGYSDALNDARIVELTYVFQ
ncbi:receptor-type tyrosine-protein phosphatase U-like isoform X1 [Ostrea edulis]|uniref:receptor-type tyrosine-protein phosphatase U-like isoform X1 n=1 Tax=Ostrea edulis TaxID=37623 RepID=UPI0024AFC909|nr:receptor-type tyrosine-protein phosphatase U-like isoform X1 [Ostrea edulis]